QDILPILEQALKAVHDRWPEARVEVEREYSPNLPKAVVDEELCQQVFTNLILNAYEAMPEGGKLKVAASAANADIRRGIEIRISDAGPGVPIELEEQVVNPFFTTKKNGVGLGL